MTPWDQLQADGVQKIKDVLTRRQRIVVVAPTGAGKSSICRTLIRDLPGTHAVYTHRRVLFQQLHETLLKAGIRHGCRAAGYQDRYFPNERVQLVLTHSEVSQAIKRQNREIFDADNVHLDEAHCLTDDGARELIEWHGAKGAKIIGYSATPVGLGGLYEELVEIAKISDTRKVGAVLPIECYTPSEPDLKHVRKVKVSGEFNQKQLGKAFMVQQVVGDVFHWWQILNPTRIPTLCFTPGVEESRWFCREFKRRGIRTVAMDAESIYFGDHNPDDSPILINSSVANREMVKQGLSDGSIAVCFVRFLLKEGSDIPALGHLILATAVATEEAFVQMVGRVVRSHPGMTKAVLQDHGGNVSRHGNPNANRDWKLEDTNQSRSEERKAREDAGTEQKNVTCPQCRRSVPWHAWVGAGKKCPICGYSFASAVKFVISQDGKLKKVSGLANKPKEKKDIDAAIKRFDGLYYASKNSKSGNRAATFNQLKSRFHKENGAQFVIKTAQSGATVIVDKFSGDTRVIPNAPSGNSALWGFRVKDVPRPELQGGNGYGKKEVSEPASERAARDGIAQLFNEPPGDGGRGDSPG